MKRAIYLSVLAVITVGCILWRVGADTFGWLEKDEGNEEVSGRMETLDAFGKISVEADTLDITIEKGKEYSLTYHAAGKDAPEYSLEDGVLTVTQKQKKHWHIGIVQSQPAAVIITVPEGAVLKDVDITSDVGDVDVREIIAENFECILDVGDLTAENAEFTECTIDADVGDVMLDKVRAKNLEAISDVGDVDVSLIGEIKDYNVSLETGVGEARLNGEKVKSSSRINAPDAEGFLDISADVGDIDVTIN